MRAWLRRAAQLAVCVLAVGVYAADLWVPVIDRVPWWRLDLRVAVEADRKRDDKAFQMAARLDNAAEYGRYIAAFPNGRHVKSATERRDDAAFRDSLRQPNVSAALDQYLREYPDGRHAGEARRRLEELLDRQAWSVAQGAGSFHAYRTYLTYYPAGRFVAEATARAMRLGMVMIQAAAQRARANPRLAPALENDIAMYMREFPGNPYVAELGSIRAGLAWQRALERDTIPDFKRFVAEHPGSPNVAEAHRRIAARSSRTGAIGSDCDACPELVAVPSGSFTMGDATRTRRPDEQPPHIVTIEALAVGRYEVRFREWDACVAAGGCRHLPSDEGWGRLDRPVVNVSWHDAQVYVAWLSRLTAKPYRLLTEAEWEYAARARTATEYGVPQGGRNWARHNWANTAAATGRRMTPGDMQTARVGTHGENRFLIRDMHGNAAEWVQDCFRPGYDGAPGDGSAVDDGAGCATRVVRGGSWADPPERLRSAARAEASPDTRRNTIGFRVARPLE